MMKPNIVFSLLIALMMFFSCSGQQPEKGNDPVEIPVQSGQSEDGMPLFKIYGELAPSNYIDGGDTITEAYGFRVERVSGCLVTDSLVTAVKENNQMADQLMTDQYGEKWKKEFEQKTRKKLQFPL